MDNAARLRRNNPTFRAANRDRPDIATAERKIRQEIAIMKKCNHGQIVRLFEVLDDARIGKILLGESHLHDYQLIR
jgi:[calcium/calmodulin-dependent protein kinase] kinase